jgi:GNAT superfamily N-acetyltransferase
MTEDDIEAVSAVRVTGWQFAYRGIVPQAYLDAMTIEADAARRLMRSRRADRLTTDLVAVVDHGEVVGWACLGPCREDSTEDPAAGELYALYVTPALIGYGIGSELLHAVHQHAAAHGFRTMSLWVLRDNQRARRFYERAGYVPDGTVRDDDFDGVPVTEVRYRYAMANSATASAERSPQGPL